jgi:hypothetical protein
MPSRRPVLFGAVLLLLAQAAAAQQQVHFMRESVLRPAVPEDRVVVDRVREDLAKVRLAQESYFTANQTYASELAELKGLKPSSGTSIVILMSSPKGWKAEASNAALTGAEVVHVMRMQEGESCPMMEKGGRMGGMGGMGQGGKAAGEASPPAQHQH